MQSSDYQNIEGDTTAFSKWKDYPQKITLAVLYVGTMIINYLAGAGKLGTKIGTISDKYYTLITPPGYTFGIWGVIYFLWGLFVLLQLLPNRFLSQSRMFYAVSMRGANLGNQQDSGLGSV